MGTSTRANANLYRTVLDNVIRTYYIQGMETQLPDKSVFLYTWHEGTPEARKFWRTSPQHDTTSERFESGVTITACSICGHAAADY
jgi:hypothetical protein